MAVTILNVPWSMAIGVVVGAWLVWSVFEWIGLKALLFLGFLIVLSFGLFPFQSVINGVKVLGAFYTLAKMFGFAADGGGGRPSPPIAPSTALLDGRYIPSDAPSGFDPQRQPIGAHRHGYEGDRDPQRP